MLEVLKEFEQVYCLEIPNGIPVKIQFSGNQIINCMRISNTQFDDSLKTLFDEENLQKNLASFGVDNIEIQGKIVGPCLTFTAFEAILNGDPISVPLANEMCKFLKFEFVKYAVVDPNKAEFKVGQIIRPMQELIDEDGNRIILEIK